MTTENKYFNDNVTAAEARGFFNREIFNEYSGEFTVSIEPSRAEGQPVLCLESDAGKFFLHSRIDPRDEAARFVSTRKELEEKKIAVMLGFGAGYIIEAMLNLLGGLEKLVVCEANTETLRLALSCRDLRNILYDERFFLIAGSCNSICEKIEKLSAEIESVGEANAKIIVHAPSLRAVPLTHLKVRQAFEYIQAMNSISTHRPMEHIVENNIRENLSGASKPSPGISALKGTFKEKKIIVVGAGPSLDYNAHLLREVQDRAVIAAVDVSLRPLMLAGVHPHIMITLDPKIMPSFFQGCEHFTGSVIHSAGSRPDVLKLFDRNEKYAFLNESDAANPMLSMYGKYDALGKNPSVFLLALDLAAHCGAQEIIMIGSDLAVEKSAIHAAGVGFSDKALNNWSKLRLLEGYFDVDVRTTLPYYIFKTTLEAFIKNHNEILFFNATEGGAKIKGATPISMREIVFNFLE